MQTFGETTRKCRSCGVRCTHLIAKAGLRPDPKYPDKRSYDERDVVTTCNGCGHAEKSRECPNLLADIFSV